MKKLLAVGPLLLAGCIIHDDYEVIPARDPVSSLDVLEMRKTGASDDVILAAIYSNGVNRKLGADDIVMLKNHGVSDAVIKSMIEAPIVAPRPEQVISRRTTYYHSGADNLLYFGLGALWGGWGHHGHWRCR